MIEKIYSVNETARILGVTNRTIFNYIKGAGDRRLAASKVGRLWKIRESDLQEFISRRSNNEQGEQTDHTDAPRTAQER